MIRNCSRSAPTRSTCKAFGADPKPSDAILSLPLLKPHQDTLRAIGATNARALLHYSAAELAAVLHVGSSTAAEMLEVAFLANSVSEQPALRAWSIDITELLLQQGVKDVGQVPQGERVDLAMKVHKGLSKRGLRNCPELADVCGWIAP